jgi:hypothetical protein
MVEFGYGLEEMMFCYSKPSRKRPSFWVLTDFFCCFGVLIFFYYVSQIFWVSKEEVWLSEGVAILLFSIRLNVFFF